MAHRPCRLPALLLAIAALAAPGYAQDRVILKNGSEIEGRIVADTGESLVLAVSAAGASGTMTFRYATIAFVNDVDADEIQRIRALANDIEKRLQERRGLELVQQIRKDVVTSSSFVERMGKDLDRLWPTPRMEAARKAATRLGLFPEGFDLKARVVDQTVAERAAYYDAPRRTLVLLIGAGAHPESAALDRFASELGRSGEEFGITREIAGLLVRENFGLKEPGADPGVNADQAIALQALAAGDALSTVLDDWFFDLGVDPGLFGDISGVVSNAPRPGRAQLARQPAAFQALWDFPTRQGTAFVQLLKRVGGWKLVDRAYQEPPASTEQILHPEKYVNGDAPTEIYLGDFGDALGPNVAPLETATLGEFRLSQILAQHLDPKEVETACSGWDGDQYAAFEKPNKSLAAVWFSTWDSERDAAEFADLFKRVLQTTHDTWSSREGEPMGGLFETENDMVAIEARGTDVVVLLGIPENAFENVWRGVVGTRKGEPRALPRPRVPEDVLTRATRDLAERRDWWTCGGTSRGAPGKTLGGVYENSALGFSIAVPEGWTAKEGADDGPAIVLENASLRAQVKVTVCEDPPALPLAVLVWGFGWGRSSIPSSENRRKPVPTVLAGGPALGVLVDSVSGSTALRRREICGQHGPRLYRITLQAASRDFDGLEPKFSGIVKSFKFAP